MAQPNATIRPYVKAEDDKVVRFMVGKAHMELLAVANRRVSRHPISLSIWVLSASIFIAYMKWFPTALNDILNCIRTISALALCILPIVFLSDWLNRDDFEQDTQQALAGPDIKNSDQYFSRSPASGFWVLDYNSKFVGLIALDASLDALTEYTSPSKIKSAQSNLITNANKTDKKNTSGVNRNASGTASVAQIRHFYVQENYRSTGVQLDLLTFAIGHAFSKANTIQKIRCTASSLAPYIGKALKEVGFEAVEDGKTMGVLGWREKVYEVKRERWEERSQEEVEGKKAR